MKVPQSVTSWLYGKVGLYPGYFQVISWLYEFYKHTNVVISWLFSIYNCTDLVISWLFPVVYCRNKAIFNRKSPHFSMRAFRPYLPVQSCFNVKQNLSHQSRIRFDGCFPISSGGFPNFFNKETDNHIRCYFFFALRHEIPFSFAIVFTRFFGG